MGICRQIEWIVKKAENNESAQDTVPSAQIEDSSNPEK
jgi:hypothetical protein